MIFFLSDIFQHRPGVDEPPEHGHRHRQPAPPAVSQRKGADLYIAQKRHQRKWDDEDQKRQSGADIAPGITGGRDLVHPFIVFAHIHDERVIKDDRAVVADHRDHEDDQCHAIIDEGQRQRKTGDDADIQEETEKLHLPSFIIGHRSQDRRHQRQQQPVDRIGPADIDTGIPRRDLCDQQRKDDGTGGEHLRGIADIIEDPAHLLFRISHFCQYLCKVIFYHVMK